MEAREKNAGQWSRWMDFRGFLYGNKKQDNLDFVQRKMIPFKIVQIFTQKKEHKMGFLRHKFLRIFVRESLFFFQKIELGNCLMVQSCLWTYSNKSLLWSQISILSKNAKLFVELFFQTKIAICKFVTANFEENSLLSLRAGLNKTSIFKIASNF